MSNGGRSYSSFNIAASASCGSCALSEKVITVTKTANRNNVAAYISFKAELVLPAYTKVKVAYSYLQKLDRTSDGTSEDAQASSFVYYFGDSENGGSDKSVNEPFPCSTTGQDDTVVSSSYCLSSLRSRFVEEKSYPGVIPEITYSNNTGSDKTCTAYFGFYVVTQYSGMQNVGGTHTLALSENITTETVDVQADKNSDIYSADGNIFNFNFNKYQIKLSSVNFTDTAGESSSLYNGTGECPVSANGECKLTGAGTYSFDFDITGEAKWADTNDKRTKQITLTIDKAKPNVKAAFEVTLPDPLYTSYNDGKLPKLINDAENATDGKIEWQTGQSPSASNSKYYWQFTPDDTLNYNNITGRTDETQLILAYKSQSIKNLEITLREEDGAPVDIYDAFTLGDGDFSLKKYITVKAVYQDGTTKVTLSDSDYALELDDGSENLSVGSVTLVAIKSDDGKSGTLNIQNVLASEVKDLLVTYKDGGTHLKYSDTLSVDDIKANLTVRAKWNYSGDDYVEVTDKSEYSISGVIKAGSPITLTANYGGKSKDFKPTIDKGDYSISDSLFPDKTVTYSGTAYDPDGWIDTDKLPDGVSVTYSCSTDLTTLGEHTVKATFATTDANYNKPADMTAKLTITEKELHDMSGVTVSGGSDGVKVEGDAKDGFTASATYDGGDVELTLDTKTLPEGVTVKETTYEKKQPDGTWVEITGKPNGAGEYRVTVSFDNSKEDYATPDDMVIDLTIDKADVEVPEDTVKDSTAVNDGKPHKVEVKDEDLPEGVSGVEYEYVDETTGKTVKTSTAPEFTKPGAHKVKVHFILEDEDNYNEIEPKEITLTISDAVLEKIEAVLENGAEFTTANTLDDLKAKLKVTAVYNNGATADVTDYELSCNGLRDNGKFKYGNQSVTVTYKVGDDEFSVVVNNIMVSREKVALPTFKGGLKYTGVEFKPTVENFNGFDADIMTFVADKTVPGLAVGTYKAVFALNDPENYEWATAKTLKKTVFAVVYDEMVLNANEAAVDWNISKAVLTATKSDGALPVFASESYIGAFADVVTLKYYKDEACTEEVAAADLAKETQYFVKAELLDTDNFELDASAAQYTAKSFTYTTPAKELTLWDKIVKFVVTNWLWLVIAAAALLFLIILICIIASAKKKKRIREEQRRLEEKEEKKREQEERERKEEERRQREDERRREEREERMAARMAQPQMMPQMPQMMGGQMPQSMPQQAQPMAGGATSNEIAELKAEIAAMKATQDMAKEIAELRVEVMRAEQNAVMRSDVNALRFGGEQAMTGGITLDKLTELIRTEVNNAFESREKTAAAPTASESATPVAAQVPPDAVMTTVTTTKIDTTKKPAQTAQTSAPAPSGRTVVRNFVAPMPVDDGRVFDVGGFYTPADPITDMGFTDDENKD